VRNFYRVLGIAATADGRRIKSAFRRRAKAVHPDLNPGNMSAEARFIELVQAYEVLSDAGTRVAYDAYLAERRRQARRRFAHCAGLMAASFMLTATSALLVLGFAGANVPYRETWQLAVAAVSPSHAKASAAAPSSDTGWTAQVVAAPVSASPAAVPSRAEPGQSPRRGHGRRGKVDWRTAVAPSKAPVARSRDAAPDTSGKEHRQQVAVAARPAPASAKRPVPAAQPAPAPQESWWSFPAAEEPRYGLGASGLQ
jgi:curved DNA-binding protein CbpA